MTVTIIINLLRETKLVKALRPTLLFSISKQWGASCECPHTYIDGGRHYPVTELPFLYTWMSRTIMPLTAVLCFPASLLVNGDDPASLSLSDTDCFSLFSGFSPQILFLDLVSRSFCCHKNRQKYLLRFDLLVAIFCRTLIYLYLTNLVSRNKLIMIVTVVLLVQSVNFLIRKNTSNKI